jgi:DNA anti-recombination protein RmuC
LRNQDRWAKDIRRFSEEFTVLGRHLRNSQTKYEEAVRYLDRLVSQFEMLSGAGASEIEGGGQKPLPSGPQPPQDAGNP